jgi:hypothetical protein
MSQALVTTDAQGRAESTLTLGTALGHNSVQAHLVGADVVPAVFDAISQPGSARKIALSSGNQQSVRFGVVTAPLIATVTDASGNPVSDYTVSFRVTAGGGSVTAATAPTDAIGEAQIRWIVGGPGVNTVEASAEGLAGSPLVFSANVSAFANGQTLAQGNATEAVVADDLNADGKPDLVLPSSATAQAIVLRNTSATGSSTITFAVSSSPPAVSSRSVAVVAGDLNGDSRPDLVFGYFDESNLSVFLNTTTAGSASLLFAANNPLPIVSAVLPFTLPTAVADINGDGRPDVITVNSGSGSQPSLLVSINATSPGATTPTFPRVTPVTAAVCSGARPGTPQSLAIGDINGDGKPDAVVACGEADGSADATVAVFLNATTNAATIPAFGGAQGFPIGRRDRPFAAVGDLNGDGKPDLVVVTRGAGAFVLLNTTPTGATTATFSAIVEVPTDARPMSVIVADLNGDGRPDVATGNQTTLSLSVLANLTPAGATAPSFAGRLDLPLPAVPEAITSADMNGDGLPDLIAVSKTSVSVFVGQ